VALRFGVQVYHSSVNGNNLRQAIIQQANHFADPDFRPSSSQAGKGSALINAKEKGISAMDILIGHRWIYLTMASFFGTYGWMMYFSPPWFYCFMIAGSIGVVGWLSAMALSRSPPLDRAFYILAGLLFPLIVALSFYHSWTSDFQAQGRYLFPFLPILFYLLHSVKPTPSRVLAANAWGLFLLSVYGFVIFGLSPLCNWQ
jgi:hypothetical protein